MRQSSRLITRVCRRASTFSARLSSNTRGPGVRSSLPDTRPRLQFVPISFKYGAEALALLGIAYGLIKWVGRTLRSVVSDPSVERSRMEALGASMPAASADLLVRQGVVTAKQLEGMSARERAFLITNAGDRLGTTTGAAPTRAGTSSAASARPTPAQNGAATPPAPRLHLVTPSRPPLGVAVHCPGCGSPLDREALQRFGATNCGRCKRPVSAHLQRGRLTVIIEETPEEAEHRRRLESR